MIAVWAGGSFGSLWFMFGIALSAMAGLLASLLYSDRDHLLSEQSTQTHLHSSCTDIDETCLEHHGIVTAETSFRRFIGIHPMSIKGTVFASAVLVVFFVVAIATGTSEVASADSDASGSKDVAAVIDGGIAGGCPPYCNIPGLGLAAV